MKALVLGTLAMAGLAVAAAGTLDRRDEALAQRPAPRGGGAAGSELIVVPGRVDEKAQWLTLVDPKLRVMSVYQIDLTTGKIALRSVRNFNWDLQMMDWNNENPLPQEIRALLEQR